MRLEASAGDGLRPGAEVSILRTLPSGRAKQKPFKASQAGSPIRRRLDKESLASDAAGWELRRK